MLTHLEMDLEQIKIKIFRMADYAMEAVTSSVSALKNSDTVLAEFIVKNDEDQAIKPGLLPRLWIYQPEISFTG